MIRLHNQNRTHTFIDVESGQFISLPKDETDKPPVNADINGLQFFGKTTQDGEPTPDNPVDLVNIPPEFNLTVCGKNLFDHRKPASFKTGNLVETVLPNGKQFSRVTGQTWIRARYVVGLVSDFIGKTITFAATASPAAGQRGRIDIAYSSSIKADPVTGTVNAYGTVDTTQRLVVTKSNIQPIEGYPYLTVAFWVSEGTPLPDNAITTYTDIQLNVGTDDTYTPYTGNTYPYRLEDLDGNLHELCSLPDGTRDEYDRDNGILIKPIVKLFASQATGKSIAQTDIPSGWVDVLCRIGLTFRAYKYPDNFLWRSGYSNMFKTESWVYGPYKMNIRHRITDIRIDLFIPKADIGITFGEDETEEYRTQKMNAWLNAHSNLYFLTALPEPQIIPIKQYGKTYDGQVWDKNEKPKSIQYHTNIFTDVGAEMQCEVRKLGNRAMGTFNWVTENGDKIITEDEDYIMLEY